MSNKRQINDREHALADTQRAIIEAAERRGYERAREDLAERNEALLRQALEALEQIATDFPWDLTGLQADTIAALRERLGGEKGEKD